MSEIKADELEHIAYMQTLEIQKLNARIAELEAAQRWIPVSERLPEKTDTVLVLADGVRVIATYHSNKNKWELLWWISSEIYGVTHWMPLPKLPEVQE